MGLADYTAALRRRRVLLLGVAIPIMVFSVLLAFALPKSYRSTGYFRLRDTSPESIRMSFSDQYVFNLRDYVMRDDNLQALVAKAQPFPDLASDVGAAADRVRAGAQVEMQTGSILDAGGHEQTINVGFTVSYVHTDPKVALEVAQLISDGFVLGGRQEALEQTEKQIQFFKEEVDRTGSRVSELEARVADFKRRNFDALPESAQSNLMARNQAEQELLGLEREITAQQQNRIFLNSQLITSQAANASGNVAALEDEYKRRATTYDESHPDMVALRRQIANARRGGTINADGSLRAELDQQRSILSETRLRYSDDHPDVKRLLGNISSLEKRIAAGEKGDPGVVANNSPMAVQLASQIHSTDTQIGSLQARRAALQGRVALLDRQLTSSPILEKEYDMLNRDLGTAKQQYDDLVKKRLEVETGKSAINAGNADKFVVASRPGLPGEPFRPNRPLIMTLGALAAVLLAFTLAILTEAIDGTVRGSKDIMSLLGVAPLAAVPEIRNSVFESRHRRKVFLGIVGGLVLVPVTFVVLRLALG